VCATLWETLQIIISGPVCPLSEGEALAADWLPAAVVIIFYRAALICNATNGINGPL